MPDIANWLSSLQVMLSVIQIWQAERNIALTKKTYEENSKQRLSYEWFIPEIEALSIIDPDILESIINRTERCKSKYQDVLDAPDGKYFEIDIDNATFAYMRCVCVELRRIAMQNNGRMPTRKTQEMWDAFGCGKEANG